jgi:hypothetical protein
MRLEISRSTCPWAIAAVAAAVLSFAGCGGGGGSSGTTTQPANQSVSGVVIDGPIQGATVCLDLNKNGACDAGEPTSTSTDAQGNYTIGGLTADQVNSGAPLIAVIPATAIDASNPGVAIGTAYTLTAPAGKGAVISPITTLVQTGVAQGMTQAEAEAAVAAQLQVAATSLYNNYVASSSGDNAALVAVVPTIVSSLQAGETLVVSAPVASAPNYWARQLDFTDTSNYYLRYYYTPNVPDSNGTYTYYDERIKLSNGSPVASSSLYDTALYATASGWKSFNGATPNTSTGGSPSVSTWGYGYVYSSTRVETDVSGMPISEVVAMAQNTTVNTFSTINGVNASALTGTMPAGAKIRKHTGVSTATPVAYRVSDGYVGSGVTTLAGLVAAFPVPATPTASNTASMGWLHNNTICGVTTSCAQERLRVAFGASNAATYYLCDISSTGAQTNCGAIGTGTYVLGTAADGSTPIMKFAGLPDATSVQTFTRVFVERSGHVYYGWQLKSDNSTTTRLNKVAFEALAAQLGIAAPTFSDSPSVYAGTWSASYTGSDAGSCSAVAIDAVGHVSGSCTSTGLGGSFVVSGSVTSTGVASFTASGATSSGATFSGSFTTTTGSGSWSQASSGYSGSWTATKP